jgi:hypothetical protein
VGWPVRRVSSRAPAKQTAQQDSNSDNTSILQLGVSREMSDHCINWHLTELNASCDYIFFQTAGDWHGAVWPDLK